MPVETSCGIEGCIRAVKTDNPDEMVLNLGPQHPSTHGVARLVIRLKGERAEQIEPVIGYLHRGYEKMAENRTYIQFIPLTDRLDYLSAITNNMVYCMAVEEVMGLEVPERAEYIRVIMLELQRLASHLVFFSSFGADLGAWTVLMYGFRERERIIDLLEMVTGARLTYNYIRFGGVRDDLPEGFIEKCSRTMEILPDYFKSYEEYAYENEVFMDRCRGVGVVSAEDAINLGLTGPNLRASGVPYDIRKIDPYSIYDRLKFKVCTDKAGDTLARFKMRIDEMYESVKIVQQCLDEIPEGEIRAKVPKVLKPPAGEAYSRVESPRGELGMYLISDGKSQSPYRLRIRSPAFCNLSGFPATAEGEYIPDVIANFASIDIVLGDVDR
ncbi:MAG: NADH-quinone oxidoreductase subunit D [Euryarchaeota archaeon]|nr:NADH-quinone oxidoreductase subunit D [Euryarchaeota archaeon]